MAELKTFEVTTSYTLTIKAKDRKDAKECFLEELDHIEPSWVEDQVKVVEK